MTTLLNVDDYERAVDLRLRCTAMSRPVSQEAF